LLADYRYFAHHKTLISLNNTTSKFRTRRVLADSPLIAPETDLYSGVQIMKDSPTRRQWTRDRRKTKVLLFTRYYESGQQVLGDGVLTKSKAPTIPILF
jgi:hypothetical protein